MFTKILSFLMAVVFMFALSACTIETNQPSETPTPTSLAPLSSSEPTKEASDIIELIKDTPVEIDMDGDGTMEILSYTLEEGEYDYTKAVFTVEYQDKTQVIHELNEEFYELSAYAVKLDVLSDEMMLVYTYTFASEDSNTAFVRFENGEAKFIPVPGVDEEGKPTDYDMLYAKFADFTEDGKIIVKQVCDTLGTRFGTREYMLLAGKIALAGEGDYTFENTRFILTTIADMPVTFIANSSELSGTLPSGTKLYLTKVANHGARAYFTTEDETQHGYIDLEYKKDDYKAYIDGKDEDHYFEFIPYAD